MYSPVDIGLAERGLLNARRLHLAMTVAALANEGRMDESTVHPEIEVPSVVGIAPAPGFRGVDGLRRYFAESAAAGLLARAAIDYAEVTAAGNVLASGALVCEVGDRRDAFRAWFVYRFRDELISAIETYADHPAALAAALRPA